VGSPLGCFGMPPEACRQPDTVFTSNSRVSDPFSNWPTRFWTRWEYPTRFCNFPHAGNGYRCLLTFAGPHHKSQSAPISFLTDIRILLPPSLAGMAAWGVRFGETQGYASAQQAVSVAALGALSRAFLYLFLISQSHLAKSFFC